MEESVEEAEKAEKTNKINLEKCFNFDINFNEHFTIDNFRKAKLPKIARDSWILYDVNSERVKVYCGRSLEYDEIMNIFDSIGYLEDDSEVIKIYSKLFTDRKI